MESHAKEWEVSENTQTTSVITEQQTASQWIIHHCPILHPQIKQSDIHIHGN
jgi:hypothetical protein